MNQESTHGVEKLEPSVAGDWIEWSEQYEDLVSGGYEFTLRRVTAAESSFDEQHNSSS